MAVKRHTIGIAAPLILVLLAFALYAGAIQHPRILDEDELVWSNPAVAGGSAAQILEGRWQAGDFRPQSRPVATLVRATEHAIFDYDRGKYQFDQILLHGVAGILLFLLLRRWFRSGAAALLGGALFVAHPAASNSILYLGGLSEILATVFGFLALLSIRVDAPLRRRNIVAVGSFLFLSILSKEVGLLFALVAGGILLASRPAPQIRRAYGLAIVAGFLAALIYRIGALAAVPEIQRRIPAIDPTSAIPYYPLVLQSLAGIAVEIGVLIAPFKLSIDYSWLLTLRGAPLFALTATGILLAGAGLWLAARRRSAATTGLALICVLPILAAALLPGIHGTVAGERILYPALAGWCGLMILLGRTIIIRRPASGPILAGVAVGIVALLGVRSFLRVPDFSEDTRLLTSSQKSYPKNPQVLYMLGNERMTVEDYRSARGYYEEALKLRPDFPLCAANLGVAYLGEESYGLALRVLDPIAQRVRHVRALRQVDAKVNYHAGLVLMQQNRFKEASEAFERTLLFYPDHIGAIGNLGLIYVKSPPYAERGIQMLKSVLARDPDERRRATLNKALTMAESLLKDYIRQRGDLPSKLEPEASGALGEPWKKAADEGM
jgi:tetratricopeptide (TPR) repeat protein